MKYADWDEFVMHSCRHEIKVSVTETVYSYMYDWCGDQDLPGVYYCSFIANSSDWAVPAGLLVGRGAFYFSESKSAVIFALRWAGELCTTV